MTEPVPGGSTPAPNPGRGPVGVVRNPWAVIGLSFITCGIYFLYWNYAVFKEMKDHTGVGIGGPIGLVIAIFIGIVNAFLIPKEIEDMYKNSGQASPVQPILGLWWLLPIVGFIIWAIKVQEALNAKWQAGGAAA